MSIFTDLSFYDNSFNSVKIDIYETVPNGGYDQYLLCITHNGENRVLFGIICGANNVKGAKFFSIYCSDQSYFKITQGDINKPLIITRLKESQLRITVFSLSLNSVSKLNMVGVNL